ncbi:Tetratricopeptide repeat protein [compost metagenome]
MGKYAECIEASNKVATFPGVTSQEKANAHYNAGMAYEKMGQYRDAAQQYQKAANTVSNNTAYLSALKRVRKQIK